MVVFAVEVASQRITLEVKTLLVHVELYISAHALYLHICPNVFLQYNVLLLLGLLYHHSEGFEIGFSLLGTSLRVAAAGCAWNRAIWSCTVLFRWLSLFFERTRFSTGSSCTDYLISIRSSLSVVVVLRFGNACTSCI